jgi:hypothetical protein
VHRAEPKQFKCNDSENHVQVPHVPPTLPSCDKVRDEMRHGSGRLSSCVNLDARRWHDSRFCRTIERRRLTDPVTPDGLTGAFNQTQIPTMPDLPSHVEKDQRSEYTLALSVLPRRTGSPG